MAVDRMERLTSYLVRDCCVSKIEDPDKQLINLDPLPLGAIHFELLLCLINNRYNPIVKYEQLERALWEHEVEKRINESYLRKRLHVHIHKIKTEMGDSLIRTFTNRGYKLNAVVEEINGGYILRPRPGLNELEFDFDEFYCTPETLDQVLALRDFMLRNTTGASKELLLRRYEINNHIIRCVRIDPIINSNVVVRGYYVLYPITIECKNLIRVGAIRASQEIEDRHICKNFEQASALYLSLVCADGEISKALTLRILKKKITAIKANHEHIEYIYTRPCTEDGWRLIGKYEFSRLPGETPIHFRSI